MRYLLDGIRVATAACIALFFSVPGAPVATGQPASPVAPTRAAIISATRTIIGHARYATLVTVDASGQPQARIVDPFLPEDDLTIWIATNARSRKVGEIAANGRVTLLYFDANTQSYVTVIGRAGLVRDETEKGARWKEEWATFYKNKNHGDDYLLIRVVPSRLEVVSPALGLLNDPDTWRPVILELP